MELILISNTKLKIMLDESDMKKYHIGSEVDCSGGTTRKAIRSLLDRARDQIGFNTEGEEIFVQLYASKRGGCELFVTKCKTPSAQEGTERVKSPVVSEDGARERKPPRQETFLSRRVSGQTTGILDRRSRTDTTGSRCIFPYILRTEEEKVRT